MKFGADNLEARSVTPSSFERQPSEEFNYTFGADLAATPRITIAGDVIGRVVKNSAALTQVDSGAVGDDRFIVFEVTSGTVHLLLGAVGVKVNVGGSWLATGTILFPLNDNGIRPALTPVIGFERSF